MTNICKIKMYVFTCWKAETEGRTLIRSYNILSFQLCVTDTSLRKNLVELFYSDI